MFGIDRQTLWVFLVVIGLAGGILFWDLPVYLLTPVNERWLLKHEDLHSFVFQMEELKAVARNGSRREAIVVYKTRENTAEPFFEGVHHQATQEGWQYTGQYQDNPPTGPWKPIFPGHYSKRIAGGPFGVFGEVIVLFNPEEQIVTVMLHYR